MRSALLRLAMHYMEDADEAEDVIQEVLLKLWFLREKLDQYRSMDALARVITKHLCLNRKRGQNIELVALEEGFGIIGAYRNLAWPSTSYPQNEAHRRNGG